MSPEASHANADADRICRKPETPRVRNTGISAIVCCDVECCVTNVCSQHILCDMLYKTGMTRTRACNETQFYHVVTYEDRS